MRPTSLAPAVLELRTTGLSIGACGAMAALAVGDPARQDLRAGAAGLAGALIVLWVLVGARAARRAARLAVPVSGRWRLEGAAVTLLRVVVTRTVPAAALAAGGAVAAAPYAGGAGAAAAGALIGAGTAALLAAQRVRRAERVRGRRLLHAPALLCPLGRSSLFLEPAALADGPGGPRPAAAPWPSHRPPQRAPRAAIELEPANGAASHGAGVRPRPPGRVSAAADPPRRGPAAGG